ncbi:MAG: hypothetical protein LC098_13600 [Burkholderiales bacterium]|nr:hypothetical protein [Burkholderiales bacterium]
MQSPSKLIGIAFAGLLTLAAHAEPTVIVCPPTLDATESPHGAVDGWQVEVDHGKRGKFLDSISVFSGPPNEMANLVPDKTSSKSLERKSLWRLRGPADSTYWVACSYINSTLLLTRALPAGTRQCELSERLLRTGARLSVDELICQ